MRPLLKPALVLLTCTFYLLAAPARADVAPPDICQGEGTACDNAGPSGSLPGICKASKCSSPEPRPDGGVIIRDCLRCMPSSGGGGSSGAAGAAGAAAAGSAGSEDDAGCSCRLSSAGAERAVAATLLLIGFVAFRGWRRRR
jgi:MYXO-CTERM domain-containing protein